MGIPNSVATCGDCEEVKSYYPGQAMREGFTSDYTAAEAWARQHKCAPSKEPMPLEISDRWYPR